MSNRYSIFPATLVTSAPATIDLRQMESYSFQPNATKAPITPGGALDPAHVGLANAMPIHQFGTRDLTTIFANISLTTGLAIDGTNPAATFRYQQRKCGDGFETGTSHVGRSVVAGHLVPRTLTANSNDNQGALINMEMKSLSADGTTTPDSKASAVDFSAVSSPTFTSRFFFGPVYLNASKLNGIEGVTIDFGLTCNAKVFDGVYPQCATIDRRDPKITFTGTNAAIDAAISSFINDLPGTLAVYLRKGAHGQSRVADGTAQHIKISIASGEYSVDDESVQGTDDGEFSFTATPTGTLAISTASAIP